MIKAVLFFAILLLMIDFLVTGSADYVGLLIFLALLTSVYVTRWQIKMVVRRSSRNDISGTDFSIATTLMLVAYMIRGAGVFLVSAGLIYLQIIILPVIKHFLIKKLDTAKQAAAQNEVRVIYA